MKIGKSLVELATEIQRQVETKKDYVAPTSALEMWPADNGVKLQVGDKSGKVGGEFDVNPLAHAQIAEFAGIPKPYYDRMLKDAPALLAQNVNKWVADEKGSRMVRTLDGNVRAFLSDKYRPLENADLAQAVLPVLFKQQLEIISCEITERKLYIKAADKRIQRDIPSGRKMGDGSHVFFDTVSPAIVISNSEVGFGALSIETAVWTRACTNLAIFGQRSLRKYHTGGRASVSDEVYAMLSDGTRRITDAAVWAQVRDLVGSAFDQAKFDASLQEVTAMAEQKIVGDTVKVVNVVGERFGLNKGESNSVLKHLIEGGDLSRYGLFNAITRTAEDLADYDRATEFERTGGKLIELPRNEWEVLAKAA